MTAVASSSSSKGSFPFSNTKHSLKFDEFLSEIPRFYSSPVINESSSSTTFRTNTTTLASFVNDPELFLGDNCDSGYENMLMNSDLLQLLNHDIDGYSKTNQDLNVDIFCSPETHKAQKRLEMLLAHITKDSSNTKGKEKGKGKGKQ